MLSPFLAAVTLLLLSQYSFVEGSTKCAWVMYGEDTCKDKIDQDGLTRWFSSAMETISSMNTMTITLSSEMTTETFDAGKIDYYNEGYCSASTTCDQIVDTPIWCNVDEASCNACSHSYAWCTNFRGYCNVGTGNRTAEASVCDGFPVGHPFRNENKDNCENGNFGTWCTSVYPEWGQGFCSWDGCQSQASNTTYCQFGEANCEGDCYGEWCDATESIPAFNASTGYCTWSTCQGEPSSRSWCDDTETNCRGLCKGMWCFPDGAPTPAPTPVQAYAGYCNYWGHCDEYDKPTREWCDMSSDRCTASACNNGTWCPPTGNFNGPITTPSPTHAPTPSGIYGGYCKWVDSCNAYDTVDRSEWCQGEVNRCTGSCSGTWCPGIGADVPYDGYCMWGDVCNEYVFTDRTGYCQENINHCTGACNGKWCPPISAGNYRRELSTQSMSSDGTDVALESTGRRLSSFCGDSFCSNNHLLCALAGCPGYRRRRRLDQEADEASVILGMSIALANNNKDNALNDPSMSFRFTLSDGYSDNGIVIPPYIPASPSTCNTSELFMLVFN